MTGRSGPASATPPAGEVTARADLPVKTVLVLVGTDIHRFDRLLDWLTDWHTTCPQPPRLVVQYGHSTPPRLPGATAFLDHEGLQQAMRAATLVVSHGGPATITEARRCGRRPIVVPRDPTRGEHVDDHQQRFARRLAAAGLITLCESPEDLVTMLGDGLHDPGAHQVSASAGGPAPAVARVGKMVDFLIDRRRSRR